ncbi:MAG: molybdopterin molybdotransferase MoeA [Deltaproteobacteria bacterium]|jgi:molybdopterin molybdotransferase|nr:molybdopterin molybdotransferase MoeA [Deltaproteobacteria bacterium]
MWQQISLETATELLLSETAPLDETVTLPLNRALGQICAHDIQATVDNPPFDRSPLDGVAFRASDTDGATDGHPVKLKLVGVVYAGQVLDREVGAGEAVRIMTGAAMPIGVDAMLPKEVLKEENGQVFIPRKVGRHENYIFRGEDITPGTVFLTAGTKLTHAHLGMLATNGQGTVTVYRSPVIGMYCIGDEFSQPDKPLEPGKIYNSNGIMLTSRLAEYGLPSLPHHVLGDDPESAAREIKSAMDNIDILITAGSVSVGDKDIMHEVFDLLGVERYVSRLAFKPGSAFLCGKYQNKWIFSLSGNPFAALATMELVVRPVLAKHSRRQGLVTRRVKAILASPLTVGKGGNKRRFLRGRLVQPTDGGPLTVILPEGHSSGRVFSLAGCNCLVDINHDINNLPEQTWVEAIDLRFNDD